MVLKSLCPRQRRRLAVSRLLAKAVWFKALNKSLRMTLPNKPKCNKS
jgi:hypothetical protein